MRRKSITLTAAIADRDGVCAAQKPTEAADMTIAGALATSGVATFDIPRHGSVYTVADESGKTFTFYGTHRDGRTINEAVVGPDTGTAKTTKNFKTVTRVAASAATTGNIEIGSADEFDSQVIPIDCYAGKISYSVNLSSGADLTYEVKYTLDDIYIATFTESGANFIADLGPQVADVSSASDAPISALRVEVTSWTSASDYIYLNILTADK